MGKNQHSKDKMYLTAQEWSQYYGGKRTAAPGTPGSEFKRLPFDCCAISFQPFEHPVCTPSGTVYELMNILPYLKKYGTDPATGTALDAKQLTRLHFHRNGDGAYHCPVTFKVFNENTHIMAVKTTGNVYCKDAIDTLNVKAKNWKDLLTDEPFTRADLITLQDPADLTKFNIQTFFHLQHNQKASDAAERQAPDYKLRHTSSEAAATLAELKATEAKWKKPDAAALMASPALPGDVDVPIYRTVKDKGYVQLRTTLGDLNFELFCDAAPRACDNFMRHCRNGYYNGTIFHRLIPGFMVQGGDPTGTGTGGQSAFAAHGGSGTFSDEFSNTYTHSARGVLAMANSGLDTNKSQFYITFAPCPHLDRKHTVFGRVVGGLDTTLAAIEAAPADKTSRKPLERIAVLACSVFADPIEAARTQATGTTTTAATEVHASSVAAKAEEKADEDTEAPTVYREGVGKYLKPAAMAGAAGGAATAAVVAAEPVKKKIKGSGGFGDFGSW